MRFTLLTLGTRGDVQPMVALGQTLRSLGHDVVVGAGPTFRCNGPKSVEHGALKLSPCGPVHLWAAARTGRPSVRRTGPPCKSDMNLDPAVPCPACFADW